MYHYMKTVHAGDTRNRLIRGIAGLCVRYYRFPDTQINWQINPVFMRVPRLKNKSDLKMTTKKSDIVRNNQK